METANLKIRNDLIISRQSGDDENIYVIKDPQTDRYFRLKEVEFFIARLFDGDNSSDSILKQVEEKYDLVLSTENLGQFSSRLKQIGLLSDGENGSAAPSHKPKRIAGDIFYLRFKLFDPDRLFNWLLPKISFLFTPAFLGISALLVIVATGVTIINWTEIMYQFRHLFRFESLLLAWLVVLAVITLHEFAHGLTCRHFGGRVREIGFLLIYFQPAFYCNVSDAWLFPQKSHRMWVTFAGAYFEIFLWATATLTWLVTDPDTSLNHFALVVTATSAIKSFFNMNPLIKLDGYYLLSDWLSIPNLRQKAFAYLGSRIKRFWGNSSTQFADITQRERRIYLIYALLAGVYTYWLLGKLILWFGGLMVDRYQGWGFVLFTTAFLLFFRNPITRVLSPVLPRKKAAKDKKHLFPKKLRLGMFLAAALAILFLCRMELRISGSFLVLPNHNADIQAPIEGTIEEIPVNEGEFISKGTIVARLYNPDYLNELRKTSAEIKSKEAQLKLLKAGPRSEEIELAKTQVSKAEEIFQYAQNNLEKNKILANEKVISKKEFDDIAELASIRGSELQEATEHLEILLAGNRPEEIDAMRADIHRLQEHQQFLQGQLGSLTIVSPISGVVTTHKLNEKVGLHVKKGDLVVEVHDLKTMTVEIAIPEKEIGDVKVGQKVLLRARAYPQTTFEGKVNAIAPVAVQPNEWQQDRTVLVITHLENKSGLLKPQMTGNARIYCGKQRLVDLAARRFVRYFKVEFWSWW